jgi:molybdopterin-guanine dinucleotide biosynthesis protein A
MIKEIEEYIQGGGYSIYSLVKALKFSFVKEKVARRFSPNWDMFINFNTREDICKYLGNGSCD